MSKKTEFFVITRLSREDIKGEIKKRLKLTEKQINTIPDIDMEGIASKMADDYLESGVYWDSLRACIQNYFEGKKGGTE